MKKLILISAVAAFLMAGEFQFGKGTFTLEGGFAGLNSAQSSDITTYSWFEQHKNLFDSKWYYGYDVTWNESDDVNNAQQTLDPIAQTIVPSTKYKFQGIDLNLIIGKDLVHNTEDDFVGLGVLLGATFPWIDSDSDSSNSNDTLKKSKTKIITYKIGPTLSARKSFNKYLMFYANVSYAYQTANVKNTELNIDQDTDGTFFNYGFGLRFQPFKTEKKVGFITLKPKLYFTIGYKYNQWLVKDVSINVDGVAYTQKSDLKMTTQTAYLGVGYSF